MEYRVLARKYRPANFDHLIGQDVLVQTLSNAMQSGRIAHAFLLTGIRGIGKTTTARIIARALNCIGEDGKGGPTTAPCGVCSHCTAIAEDRHVDVLEMDAASHTGVDDVRELIESVRYLPSMARYKVYIIDEVHMLSKSAFNALLKTLEEPPPHVKFIFATTEVRKIPVTILSRCQRFDLKRIDTDMLTAHLQNICGQEKVEAQEEALRLIALAAEGSVRDALSLLDQAIAAGDSVETEAVRHMIGSADNGAVFRLLETLLKGEVAGAMEQLKAAYHDGVAPLALVQRCMEVVHLVTRMKISAEVADDISLSQQDREQAAALAQKLSMPQLTRLWQMLLKGLGEVKAAPSPLDALEMLLVRIAYAADLPTPSEVIRKNEKTSPPDLQAAPQVAPQAQVPAQAQTAKAVPSASQPQNYVELVELFSKKSEPLLYTRLRQDVHLVHFAPCELTLRVNEYVSREDVGRIKDCLKEWTGENWRVTLSKEDGEPTLHQKAEAQQQQNIKQVEDHPLVASVLEQFPGAKVVGVNE